MANCLYKFVFFSLMILLVISCSEEVKPSAQTYSKLLTGDTSKTWQMSALMITIRDGNHQYNLNIDNSCPDSIDYYDNYYTFYANQERTMEISEGPEKCTNFPHDDYFYSDNWSLVNATATLNFTFLPLAGENNIPYIIKEFTEKKIFLEYYNDQYIFQFELKPVTE